MAKRSLQFQRLLDASQPLLRPLPQEDKCPAIVCERGADSQQPSCIAKEPDDTFEQGDDFPEATEMNRDVRLVVQDLRNTVRVPDLLKKGKGFGRARTSAVQVVDVHVQPSCR